jgi:hypothetical protein
MVTLSPVREVKNGLRKTRYIYPGIGPQPEKREPFQSLYIGLLDEVFSFFGIPCQPTREIIQLVEKRHSQLFERVGLRASC